MTWPLRTKFEQNFKIQTLQSEEHHYNNIIGEYNTVFNTQENTGKDCKRYYPKTGSTMVLLFQQKQNMINR